MIRKKDWLFVIASGFVTVFSYALNKVVMSNNITTMPADGEIVDKPLAISLSNANIVLKDSNINFQESLIKAFETK